MKNDTLKDLLPNRESNEGPFRYSEGDYHQTGGDNARPFIWQPTRTADFPEDFKITNADEATQEFFTFLSDLYRDTLGHSTEYALVEGGVRNGAPFATLVEAKPGQLAADALEQPSTVVVVIGPMEGTSHYRVSFGPIGQGPIGHAIFARDAAMDGFRQMEGHAKSAQKLAEAEIELAKNANYNPLNMHKAHGTRN